MNLLKTSSIILLSSLFLTGCGTTDFQWDVNDTEFSFKIVKGYMTHPEIVTLDHPDEELLNLMLENLDENSY